MSCSIRTCTLIPCVLTTSCSFVQLAGMPAREFYLSPGLGYHDLLELYQMSLDRLRLERGRFTTPLVCYDTVMCLNAQNQVVMFYDN